MADRKETNRKKNAARLRKVRAERDAKGLCRTCGLPAVVSKRTGRLARQCSRHLDGDIERKSTYVLAWLTANPSGKAIELRLEFPLGPLL